MGIAFPLFSMVVILLQIRSKIGNNGGWYCGLGDFLEAIASGRTSLLLDGVRRIIPDYSDAKSRSLLAACCILANSGSIYFSLNIQNPPFISIADRKCLQCGKFTAI